MTLALSTSWQSAESLTAEQMLVALKNLGIVGIELSYRISESFYQQMKEPLLHSALVVVSIHNFFPIPAAKPDAKGSGDLFLLSSPDEAERQKAVHYTTKTIEYAADLGAAAVVLHCGAVEMNPQQQMLYHLFKTNRLDSHEGQAFIRKKINQRDRHKARHLDSLFFSLDRLAPVAENKRVLLGLENRYHYHELPGLDDFKALFDKFRGAPIGYWHDTGHAHANEILGLTPRNALLQNYADRLIGVHLHDAIGLDDHIPPGAGEIDFTALKPFLKAETLKVMEIKPGIPTIEVSKGIRFIRETLTQA
ncbi:MAG: sugar phosphate isomerase/epimerase [Deltaproteobacteria bacterium]|nr:sugar phosphate isomerase/epimerase [Deltaproteobacteria bacterium]